MQEKKYSKDICIEILNEKYRELLSLGDERYPKRSDFSNDEVVAIKSFLGPWPRALEASGIKPCRDDGYIEKKLTKRINAKRKKTEYKKERTKNKGI